MERKQKLPLPAAGISVALAGGVGGGYPLSGVFGTTTFTETPDVFETLQTSGFDFS